MATKKMEEVPVNSNINTNTNNINVNVNVHKPKRSTKSSSKKKSEPNWVIKAIIVGIIGLVLSFLWNYYVGDLFDGGEGNRPKMHDVPAIKGN